MSLNPLNAKDTPNKCHFNPKIRFLDILLLLSVFPSCAVFEPIYGYSVSFSGTGFLSLYILSQGWVL